MTVYFWTALYIEDNLEEVRDMAITIGEQTGVKCPVNFLPLHVSLKISFKIDDSKKDKCLKLLRDYLSTVGPFSIEVRGYEHYPGVVWIRMEENERLAEIHSHLDELVSREFGVKPDVLDLKFIYHCTLFFDEDSKLDRAMELISKIPLPGKVHARDFLIGASDDGLPGTYSILSHSHLGPEVNVKEQWDQLKESK